VPKYFSAKIRKILQ